VHRPQAAAEAAEAAEAQEEGVPLTQFLSEGVVVARPGFIFGKESPVVAWRVYRLALVNATCFTVDLPELVS
jgi:hypothetical protein